MTSAPADPYGAFAERWEAPQGPVRVAVKDMIGVAGARMAAGIEARTHRQAADDAAVVTAVRRNGWALVGTTVTDAAGFGTMSPMVRHPCDPARAVGGSSGGAAVAVAAQLADVAYGTDTGGSVRIPAAYCDLYAFKPSNGRVDMTGVLPLSPTFDVVGALARSADRLAEAVYLVLEGGQRSARRGGTVFAMPSDAALMAPALGVRWRRVLAAFTPLEEPPYDAMALAHGRIVCAEAFATHRADFASAPEGFPVSVRAALVAGSRLGADEIEQAHKAIARVRQAFAARLKPGDLLVRPTLAIAPATRHAAHAHVGGSRVAITNANIRLTTFANVAGLPVLVVPVAGLSVQIAGAAGTDAFVLREGPAVAARVAALLGGAGHRD